MPSTIRAADDILHRSVQAAPTPLMRLDVPEVFGRCSGPRGFSRPVTRPEIDDSNGAGWQLYPACCRSMLQYRFSWQGWWEHGGVLTVPPARAEGTEPDKMLRDVLCQLIKKLRVEINVLSETDLRAGKDAKAGQRKQGCWMVGYFFMRHARILFFTALPLILSVPRTTSKCGRLSSGRLNCFRNGSN